jgi:hypothetical protein
MAFIANDFFKIAGAAKKIYKEFIEPFYDMNGYEIQILDTLNNLFNVLKNDLNVFVEHPYVDKVYRDSYYCYFSTKHKSYSRDCIRVSFFEKNIKYSDIQSGLSSKVLENGFAGYCVLRPTFPNIIGRNLISKKAYKDGNFITCIHNENVLINGKKLLIEGYPHSSQDQESITCAETTIWALMEYFGHKYAEYKPVLPSVIINKLNERSDKRMLPSSGLTPEQISYALKDFGFGTLIQTKNDDKNDFLPDLSVYIESGIPVVVAIENKKVAHAILMIGREKITSKELSGAFTKRQRIIPLSSLINRYVVQDDNMPPYSLIPLKAPATHYDAESDFNGCQITSFVVPLYKKIYMEAKIARKAILAIFSDSKYGSNSYAKHVFRLYLASSRSFKSHIALQNSMDKELQEYLLSLTMPRFVYCGEFINHSDAEKGEVSSLIVLDATEAGDNWIDSFIFAAHKNKLIFSELYNKKHEIINMTISFTGFKMYAHNLN